MFQSTAAVQAARGISYGIGETHIYVQRALAIHLLSTLSTKALVEAQ